MRLMLVSSYSYKKCYFTRYNLKFMSKKPSLSAQQRLGKLDLQKTLEQGNQLLQSKKYKKALALCKRFLDAAPDNPAVLSLAGIASHLNQQPEIAVNYFRRVVTIQPNEANNYHNLAISLKQTGNIQKAIETYQQGLKLAPDNQPILFNLGNMYLGEEKPDAAIPLFQTLLNINPQHIKALRGLGVALMNVDQLEQACDCLLKASNIAPEESEIFVELADVYSRLGRQVEAINALKVALKTNPAHIGALKNLGMLLMDDDPEEAKDYFSRATRIAPQDIDIMSGYANTIYKLGDIPAAEAIYRDIIQLVPNHAEAHLGLGNCLIAVGKKTEAIESYRTTIDCNPGYGQANLALAMTKKHNTRDDDVIRMEEMLELPLQDVTQKSFLHFGLGKAYEDLQDYDKAFNHYAQANDLKRSTINYNVADDRYKMENTLLTFSKAMLDRLENCGYQSETPIFVVGMPRSGTTLTEQIISSHPDVHGAGELNHFSRVAVTYSNLQLQTGLSQSNEDLDCTTINHLGKQYCDMTLSYDETAKHITDKMPYNFGYIGMIHLMLPNAKIIHCTRNPLDTCFSCYSTLFASGNNFTYSLEELGQYYGMYYQFMQYWKQLGIDNIVEVAYEDLIYDQENQTRRLLDACGLDWDDACLNFHKSDRPVMTASVSQVRNKIYTKSIQRWKHFESHLSPLIDTLKDAVPDDLLEKTL